MIKPYYETANGRLYYGDCLEIMPEFESVDLAFPNELSIESGVEEK